MESRVIVSKRMILRRLCDAKLACFVFFFVVVLYVAEEWT